MKTKPRNYQIEKLVTRAWEPAPILTQKQAARVAKKKFKKRWGSLVDTVDDKCFPVMPGERARRYAKVKYKVFTFGSMDYVILTESYLN
jgi:hypothetical protein